MKCNLVKGTAGYAPCVYERITTQGDVNLRGAAELTDMADAVMLSCMAPKLFGGKQLSTEVFKPEIIEECDAATT